MMRTPLADYLAATKTSHAELARRLGVTDSAVWRWAHGKRVPGTSIALRIADETKGAVPVAIWADVARAIDDERPAKATKKRNSKRRHGRSIAARPVRS